MAVSNVDRKQSSLALEIWNYRAVRWTFGRVSEVVKYPFYLISCLLQLGRVCKSGIQLDKRKIEVDSCMLFLKLREAFLGLLTIIFAPKRNMYFCFSSSFINKILRDLKNGITGVYKNQSISKELIKRMFTTFWSDASSLFFQKSKIRKIERRTVSAFNEEAINGRKENELKTCYKGVKL